MSLGSGSAELVLAQQAAPVVGATNTGRDVFQKQADTYLAVGQKRSAPLAVLSPTVSPKDPAGQVTAP